MEDCKKRENCIFFLFPNSFIFHFLQEPLEQGKNISILKGRLSSIPQMKLAEDQSTSNRQGRRYPPPSYYMSLSLKLFLVRWDNGPSGIFQSTPCSVHVLAQSNRPISPWQILIHCLWCFEKIANPWKQRKTMQTDAALMGLLLFFFFLI